MGEEDFSIPGFLTLPAASYRFFGQLKKFLILPTTWKSRINVLNLQFPVAGYEVT